MSLNMTVEEKIVFEIFKANPYAIVLDNFLKSPALIGLLAAIAFAIVLYGVSKLFVLNLTLDFGQKERTYNQGYLDGFKKAVEELSRSTHANRTEE